MTQRLLTAIVILTVAIPLVVIGNVPFIAFGVTVASIAIFEMLNLLPKEQEVPVEVKVFTVLATLYVVFSGFNFETLNFESGILNVNLVSVSIAVFFLLSVAVVRKSFTVSSVGFFLMAILYVGTTFHAMLYLRFMGLSYLLLVVAVAAISDSAAYFVGKRFGRRKLAPIISPNKTIEGAIGGTVCGVIAGILFGLATGISTDIVYLGILSLAISGVGLIGDLVASSMKRQYQIKDFGNLFPGHGGVLDRLDSHLFASLGLYILLNIMNVVN